MADFALTSNATMRPWRSPWGAFPMRTMLTSTGVSSAAIYTGSVVTLDWTGTTTAGAVLRSTAVNYFRAVGVAAQTISGSTAVTGTELNIWEANPNVEFKVVTQGATLLSSQVGTRKKLMWDSTLNVQFVDLSASTATDWRVVITGLIDAVGDSGGYVSARFLSRLTENIGTSVAVTSTTPVLAFYA